MRKKISNVYTSSPERLPW